MLLPSGAFIYLLIWTASNGLSASKWLLSDFHVFNLPDHHHEPAPGTKSYELILDKGNWASLSLGIRDVLSIVKEGRIFFALFRRGSPLFPSPTDWYEGRLHGGSLDRPIRVNLGDQLLLLADDSNGDLSKTLRLFDRIVSRHYGPLFDLTLCLEELLSIYPSLNRLRFVFATVVLEEEAHETICVFNVHEPSDNTSSGSSMSYPLNELGVSERSSTSSWSFENRRESSSESTSTSSYTDISISDESDSESDSSNGKAEAGPSEVNLSSMFTAQDIRFVTEVEGEKLTGSSPIPKPIDSPTQSHRTRKYRPKSCVIC
jgi:hypothetical protein